MRRVVLEAAVTGRVVRRGDHDAVGRIVRARRRIVYDDGPGDRRSRGVILVVRGVGRDTVRDQHLDGCRPGRGGKCVGVFAYEERPGDALGRAILHDRLGRSCDMRIVECGVQA